LFLLSGGFYFFYYHRLLLNLNDLLFQANGDSLKNYYTFLYHIKNDKNLFTFSGMNYPFGENVVYTDCQPLLTIIIRLLPFAENYAIGTMHFLILFSFIITPLLLYRIFVYFKVQPILGFFSALAIAILSPQMHRIGGHFGMAYGCVIPLEILFLLSYYSNPSFKKAAAIFFYNTGLFFIHPYLGLGGGMFSFLSIFISGLFAKPKSVFLLNTTRSFIAGLAPMLLFNLFLAFTDHRSDRTPEPYGVDILAAAANFESVFTPSFAPFDLFLKKWIHSKHVEWEALSYIGLFPMCFGLIAIFTLPFYLKRLVLNRSLNSLFISAFLLLIFAFGLHVKILAFLHIEITALNQFRCLGRYAWFFYFMLPVFLICTLSNLKINTLQGRPRKFILGLIGLLFLSLNLFEGHYFLTDLTRGNFETQNFFLEKNLSNEEKKILKVVRQKKFNAIVPFPMFHIGSDVYQKNGEASFLPAVMYSYHANLPILGEVLSRTSVSETEIAMALLNRYKKNRKITDLILADKLLVIQAGNELREDEWRVVNTLRPFGNYQNLNFYAASSINFSFSTSEKNKFIQFDQRSDSLKNIVYIRFEKHKPFLLSKVNEFQKITVLDSNKLDAGDYVVSFRYYLKEKKFKYLYNHLIVIKTKADYSNWAYFNSIRSTSGFYDTMIVYEQKISIDPHFNYEFLLNGSTKATYRISDFLLRPAALDLKMNRDGKISYNNFPE
jgi:hypothetical protein